MAARKALVLASGQPQVLQSGDTLDGPHSGDGSALTALNAANVSSGTLAYARLPNAGLRPFTWVLGSGVALATGTDKSNWLTVDFPATLLRVSVAAKTAPVGASLILDILRSTDGGATFTSIFTASAPDHRPTLATTVKTGSFTNFDVGQAAGVATVAQGDIFRIDVTQVGSTTAGQDVTVQLMSFMHP